MKIHIISSGDKWAVVKSGAKRATKLHKHKERAYHHAKQMSNEVVVHNKDGTILFIDNDNT